MSETKFLMSDLAPFSFEQFQKANLGYRPWDAPNKVDDEDWAIAQRAINYIERYSDLKTPYLGDVVRYTSKYGDHYSYARVSTYSGFGCDEPSVELCESGSVFAYQDSAPYISAGGSFKALPASLFKPLGFTYGQFWCFGRFGACAHGGIYFNARVAVWEYIDPNPKFPGFTTEHWDKWYVNHCDKTDSNYRWFCEGSFPFNEHKISFETEDDYRIWMRTYRAHEFEGFNPGQKVIWTYKENRVSLGKDEWDRLDLPIDTRLLNAAVRDCKVAYDDEKHVVTAYFYKVHDSHGSFWFSAESKYPYAYRLERDKNA